MNENCFELNVSSLQSCILYWFLLVLFFFYTYWEIPCASQSVIFQKVYKQPWKQKHNEYRCYWNLAQDQSASPPSVAKYACRHKVKTAQINPLPSVVASAWVLYYLLCVPLKPITTPITLLLQNNPSSSSAPPGIPYSRPRENIKTNSPKIRHFPSHHTLHHGYGKLNTFLLQSMRTHTNAYSSTSNVRLEQYKQTKMTYFNPLLFSNVSHKACVIRWYKH